MVLCGVSAVSAASDNAVDNLTSDMDDSFLVSNNLNAVGVDESASVAQENDDGLFGQSLNLVSASDMDNNITMLEDSNFEGDLSSVDEISADYGLSESSENTLSESDPYVIWVNADNDDDGNGSESNPFSSFEKARDDVASGKDNVIINVGDGTYNLDSQLLFNTSNLHINATSNNVIIKNNLNGFFELSNPAGNFSVSNIIIDGKYTSVPSKLNYIFKGLNANLVTFDNCTFKDCWGFLYYDLKGLTPATADFEPYIFNNCKFIYELTAVSINAMDGVNFRNVNFTNCLFYYKNKLRSFSGGESGKLSGHLTIFEDCWFGINSLPSCFYKNGVYSGYDINRYAIFNISENYLGNNLYEIIGKLIWNDSTTDGIENLDSMAVTLSTNTGNLSQTTATLEKGAFKVLYNSTSTNHKVTATVDDQPASVEFQTINISLDSPSITYGDKQNITVTLPTQCNGIIYVTVNNKTYKKGVEFSDVVTVDITDLLPVGTWDVNVTFVDNETLSGHSYGFNTTTIIVSKVLEYDFNATVTPTVYLGDNATITLSLPNGATGNVTVKVGDKEAKTFNVAEAITIDGFIAGDNVVNITYNGNDIYDAKSVVKTVIASVKPTVLAASDVIATYNVTKELVITLTSNGDALVGKTINVVVGTINKNLITNDSGQVSIDVSSLTPDTYTANIAFAGDEIYNKSSTTAKVTVKEEIKTNITIPEIVAGKATTTTITLPQNATGNVTVIVDGNVTGVVNLTNGSATVTIPELSAGKHNVTISYSGDDNYAGFAQTSAVEVKEPAKPTPKPDDQKPVTVKKTATKITAKKKTFKAKTKVKKYTITLKAGKKAVKKVQVILKIGKKTYKAKTNSKGKATFKIKKLTKKGKYTAKITFKGNKLYKATTKKVKITVKK